MSQSAASSDAELARWRRLVSRLPLTLRPSISEQLDAWEMLFPFEQQTLRRFLCGIDALNAAEFSSLMKPLRTIEGEMGVSRWTFSESSNTLENSAQLARSPQYAEWRSAVARIYATVEAQPCSDTPEVRRGGAIIAIHPANLPIDEATAWTPWATTGRAVSIRGDARDIAARLQSDANAAAAISPERNWWIEADGSRDAALPCCLNYERLNTFRLEFLAALNTAPRDTRIASDTMTQLRHRDWRGCCPPELAENARLRNFVIEVFLSGNGALIFPNSFVQWTASEALRRARPRMLVARFGVRSKPKPFTSIAIFEDQHKVSTLPDLPDPQNSALDAGILARYVWLSALRYPEYQQALCICVSEHLNHAWVVAPAGSMFDGRDVATPEEICGAVAQQVALPPA